MMGRQDISARLTIPPPHARSARRIKGKVLIDICVVLASPLVLVAAWWLGLRFVRPCITRRRGARRGTCELKSR